MRLNRSHSSQQRYRKSAFPVAIAGAALVICLCTAAQIDTIPAKSDIPPVLKIGSRAPDFNLPGIDGRMHRLSDYSSSKLLLVIFSCDHCPIASMYEKRIEQLTSDYRNRGVAVVVIMGNDPKAIHLSELGHTDLGDTLPEMKLRAAYRHFNYPYLYDGDTQSVALKYGPIATPHAFLFDQQRILRYEGRIDNNAREALVTRHELRDAMDALLAGRPVTVQDTSVMGCSTKWAYKESGASQEVAEGDSKPVTVEAVSADGLRALRKNAGTNQLLLINFWATWCGPCTEEFPELQKMIRMYAKRPLRIVTVSINSPDEEKFVLDFLQKQHAIGKNLLFSGKDSSDAVAATGTGWKGGVPYTVLIGMHGEQLYQTEGAMDALTVRRAILRNLPDDSYLGQNAYWNSTF